MPKMRVYEYAKTVNKSSKDIVNALKAKNIEVNNHMSVIDDHAIKQLESESAESKDGSMQKKR